jgi:glycerol-3-phosphate dehydrogenase
MKGKEFLAAGMKIYDLLTADRNRGIVDPSRRIPATHTLSRRDATALYPFFDRPDFTGGAIFHDGQMYSPARLALSALLSATARGARAANYAEVTDLLRVGESVTGVRVRDTLDDSEYEVAGACVLNATGGWAPELLARTQAGPLAPAPTFSRDAYFIVRRAIPGPFALAVSGSTRDPDAIMSRDARHLFLVPWRGCTLVGVWHEVYRGDPAKARVSEADLRGFLAEINQACPWLALERDEVSLAQCGLVLFGENKEGAQHLSYGKRSLVVDHERADGVRGLVTLIGVRYTTARVESERAVRLVCRKLGRAAPPSATATTRIHGGEIDDFQAFEVRALAARPRGIGNESMQALIRNHGSEHARVLERIAAEPGLAHALPGSDTLRAEVIHAVRDEMAVRLEDVVFGRTDLGTAGHPGAEALEQAALLMAGELGWDDSRRRKELERTLAAFPDPGSGARAAEVGSR